MMMEHCKSWSSLLPTHDNFNFQTKRAFTGVYNNKEDIDVLCESINKCKKVFHTLNGTKRIVSRNYFGFMLRIQERRKQWIKFNAKAHNPLCGDKVHIYLKLEKHKAKYQV